MSRISQYNLDTSPSQSDYLLGNQASGPTTSRFKFSDIITFLWTLANVPSGATSPITRDNDSQFAYVVTNTGVWSGDSYGVNKNASMTALICYINGRRIPVAAVAARVFTASKDTYIDVLDNGDGTGTLVYTEVTNNAASPALASNSLRIGIIVTGATTIAAAGSVNQGQESIILPIASSIPYQVTDSLGNLICPRDPQHSTLGYRQITGTVTFTTIAQITGLTCPVIVPLGRKIDVEVYSSNSSITVANGNVTISIWDGVVSSGTQIQSAVDNITAATSRSQHPEITVTPTAASKTYNAGGTAAANTGSVNNSTTSLSYIKVKLA